MQTIRRMSLDPHDCQRQHAVMSLIKDILKYNADFVQKREYEAYRTDQFPNKKLLVITCMDTRLVELLPRAMNLRNGDVKMIKVAGAVITHPFGSVMRSILIAVHQLHVQEIAVVGHHDCGMINFHCQALLEQALASGVSQDVIDTLQNAGIDLDRWLTGFEKVEDGVRGSVRLIRSHPLMRPGIPIHGLIIHPETGKLDLIRDGYDSTK